MHRIPVFPAENDACTDDSSKKDPDNEDQASFGFGSFGGHNGWIDHRENRGLLLNLDLFLLVLLVLFLVNTEGNGSL